MDPHRLVAWGTLALATACSSSSGWVPPPAGARAPEPPAIELEPAGSPPALTLHARRVEGILVYSLEERGERLPVYAVLPGGRPIELRVHGDDAAAAEGLRVRFTGTPIDVPFGASDAPPNTARFRAPVGAELSSCERIPDARCGGWRFFFRTEAQFEATRRAPEPSRRHATLGEYGRHLLEVHGCVACHRGEGRLVGPPLGALAGAERTLRAGRAVRVEGAEGRAYIAESLRHPEAARVPGFDDVAMPSFDALTPRQVDAIAAVLLAGAMNP